MTRDKRKFMKEWKNAQDVFQTLNKTFSYLVLRNFEAFYDSILMESHADIDLLCNKKDRKAIIQLLGAEPRLNHDDGIHYQIKIAQDAIPVDIRWDGDGYYDANWERNMLGKRVLDQRGFYHLDDDNYFWSLLYHALYHKGKISEEYALRLQNMNPYLFPASVEELEDALHQYMLQNDYYYTIARDPYLWYHFTAYCSGRVRAYPLYKIKLFVVKCREYISRHYIKV